MADTIFTDWLSALQNLQSSVSKDLAEIRKQKAEIQQLKVDIINEVARGKFIRDNERIVLSAPEIVIGNVDASGMLYGEGGSIIIRGQNLGLEGVGEYGNVKTRAAIQVPTALKRWYAVTRPSPVRPGTLPWRVTKPRKTATLHALRRRLALRASGFMLTKRWRLTHRSRQKTVWPPSRTS